MTAQSSILRMIYLYILWTVKIKNLKNIVKKCLVYVIIISLQSFQHKPYSHYAQTLRTRIIHELAVTPSFSLNTLSPLNWPRVTKKILRVSPYSHLPTSISSDLESGHC